MNLQPVRFIGHKIGPFDHIELNWHTACQGTIIVGENGTGKTTLVAAMAACLAGNYFESSPREGFDRFAHDGESYAFFEFKNNEFLASSLISALEVESNYLAEIWAAINPDVEHVHTMTKTRYVSKHFTKLQETWRKNQDVTALPAAYGPSRNLTYKPVVEFKEIIESPFKNILNPFAQTAQSDIPQWITNQFIRRALAAADNESNEADSYLDSIQRIENFFTDSLSLPLKFLLERNPIGLKIQQNGSQISLGQLSDGTRSYLSWTLDYLSRASRVHWSDPIQAAIAPGLIIVDEIDNHLHPEWQRRIMATSTELLPATHIIATTHSPFVVGSADDTQVFRICKDEHGKLQIESSYDTLFGYPADLILQKLFTESLYTPQIQKDLDRLTELAGQLTIDQISIDERQEHDYLLEKLADVSPWIANLLMMANATGNNGTHNGI